MSSILKARGVTKRYTVMNKSVDVLKNIDLPIEEGKIVFIKGPSGAGKSTLLHILGSLDKPTEGSVYYRDTELYKLSDRKLSRWRNRNIGFIFQFHYLLNDFTAADNILLPYMFSQNKLSVGRERTDMLMNNLGVYHRKDHKPSELSGGEQQRIAVARALVNDPQIILADEPTGNLDSVNTHFIMEFFRELNREEGKTFVIVTHENELTQYADSVVNLKDGVLVN
ncbi:MAG: ABC transporter ATP-binding protein [candidate division WOR-3 bacterium]|nr:ABC transporter ATP-binding protein [candidate division WOR-3 bacterium]